MADLSDPENPPDSAKAAADAACLWNLNADSGSWFSGGVATLGVQSPTGERWKCAAWTDRAAGVVFVSPMVRA